MSEFNCKNIPSYTSWGNYSADIGWRYLFSEYLDEMINDMGLDINPDFQREHVWSEEQQIKYIEHRLRGGESGRDLLFNCPGWVGEI